MEHAAAVALGVASIAAVVVEEEALLVAAATLIWGGTAEAGPHVTYCPL